MIFILWALWVLPSFAQEKAPRKTERIDTLNGKVYVLRTIEILEEVPDSAELYDRLRVAVAVRDSAEKTVQGINKMIKAYRALNRPLSRPGNGRRSATAPTELETIFPMPGTLSKSDSSLPSTVIRAVHDGDSYYLVGLEPANKFARGEGYDTPEIRSPYVGATQPWGVEVGDSVRALIKGKTVTYSLYGIGQYDRPYVSVYVDGADLGEIILQKGWGWYYTPNKLPSALKKRYKAAERAAKKAKRGLWGDPDPVKPSVWRKQHPAPK